MLYLVTSCMDCVCIWKQVVYLRRFKKLKTVNLTGNPLCQLEEYKMFVVAHLPSLDYLDYRLVDSTVVSKACSLYFYVDPVANTFGGTKGIFHGIIYRNGLF